MRIMEKTIFMSLSLLLVQSALSVVGADEFSLPKDKALLSERGYKLGDEISLVIYPDKYPPMKNGSVSARVENPMTGTKIDGRESDFIKGAKPIALKYKITKKDINDGMLRFSVFYMADKYKGPTLSSEVMDISFKSEEVLEKQRKALVREFRKAGSISRKEENQINQMDRGSNFKGSVSAESGSTGRLTGKGK